MDYTDIIATLITVLFAVVPTTLTAVIKINGKLSAVTKEVNELFLAITEGLADGTLTGEEVRRIADEADDIPGAIRDAVRRK